MTNEEVIGILRHETPYSKNKDCNNMSINDEMCGILSNANSDTP